MSLLNNTDHTVIMASLALTLSFGPGCSEAQPRSEMSQAAASRVWPQLSPVPATNNRIYTAHAWRRGGSAGFWSKTILCSVQSVSYEEVCSQPVRE